MANAGTKLWLGNQEAFSGDYHIVEESYPKELHDFIADHNADVPHQQDQIQAADGVSRPLVAATHGAASHHTKTLVRYKSTYIVRRLTPLECCRLQGFPDGWGDIDEKADFTDEEYSFWLNVRNTHAEINGKAAKDYTREQMLAWYSKLHTDSAEYKLWGNGIALPCALYVMQGIAEVQNEN
jgi:DNA (cytosine-5)-methyltransferase 1